MGTQCQSQPPTPVDPGPGSWWVVPAPDGVRIEIRPRRDWPYACSNLAVAAFTNVFGFKLGIGPLPPDGDGPSIVGIVIFAFFALTALGFLRSALLSLAGRRVLELRPAGMRVESFFGPIRQAREYERQRITWIKVEDGPLSILEELPWLGIRTALRLKVEGKGGAHRVPLVLRYVPLTLKR